MTDFNTLIQDPDFQALQPQEQIAQLAGIDEEFKKLSPQTQGELLNLYRAKYGAVPATTIPGTDFEGANPPPSGGYQITPTDVVRYGPPAAVGIVGGIVGGAPGASLATRAATLGAEVATDFMSEYFARGMEGEENESRVKGGLAAAGIGLGMFSLLKGLGWGGKKVAKKLLLPKNVPPEALITQEILRRYGTGEGSISFGRFGIGEDKTEETLIYYLESIARSGYGGSGRMSRMDIFNQSEVLDAYKTFLDDKMQKMSGVDFGVFLRQLLGEKGDSYGTIFSPFMAIKKAQYDILEDQLEALSALAGRVSVDGSAVHEMALKMGEDKLLKMRGLPDVNKAADWEELTVQQANALKENINSFYGSDESYNRLLGKINDEIKKPLEAALKPHDDAYKAYKQANAVWSDFRGHLETTTINTVRKKLESEPEAILHFLALEGAPHSKLQRLKALARQSAELNAKDRGIKFSESELKQYFEQYFLRPIKYETVRPSFVTHPVTGEITDFNSRELTRSLDFQRRFGDDFLNEVWGDSKTWKELYKFAAADEFLKRAYGESIFIKLAQAGALGGAFMGKLGKTASTILLAPYFLSRLFNNKRLVRMVTENAKLGWKAGATNRLVRKLTQMRLASERELTDSPIEAVQYYSGMRSPSPTDAQITPTP